jgi:prepilin-type N-terminal cleavage/methylation domain-containing protein
MRHDERGFSMVEVLFVMAFMGIAASAILGFLLNTTSLTTRTSADVTAERDAQLALRRITQDLRGAAAADPNTNTIGIAACSGVSYATCLTFEQPRPASTTALCPAAQFRYELVGTTIQETRKDYSATCVLGSATTSTILTGVSNGAAALFTYYGGDGNVIVTSAAPCASPPSGTCTVPKAAAVTVTIGATYQAGNTTKNLTFSSVAALRNNRPLS